MRLSKVKWPYVLLAGSSCCQLYNLETSSCVLSKKPDTDLLAMHIDVETFTLFYASKFDTYSPASLPQSQPDKEKERDSSTETDKAPSPIPDRTTSRSSIASTAGSESEDASSPVPPKRTIRKSAKNPNRSANRNASIRPHSMPKDAFRGAKLSQICGEDTEMKEFPMGLSPETAAVYQALLGSDNGDIRGNEEGRNGASHSPRSCSPSLRDNVDNVDMEKEVLSASIVAAEPSSKFEFTFDDLDTENNITFTGEKTIKTATFSKLIENLTAASAQLGIRLKFYIPLIPFRYRRLPVDLQRIFYAE